jgi:hypothetical protein
MRAAVLAVLFAATAASSLDPAAVVRSKIKQIQSGKARPGAIFTFSSSDLNAYARSELPKVAPEGVRQARLELGNGTATGFAFIDFLKLRHGQGAETPWLISKLIEGEKPVKVDARIESSKGIATVYLQRVEISGLAVGGTTLDFLVKTFFLPLYPDAKINEPFELSDRVDRIEVSPTQARVVIRKEKLRK